MGREILKFFLFEEFLDPQCIGGMAGPNQRYVPNALRLQLRSPKDKGAHEDLTHFAIGLH